MGFIQLADEQDKWLSEKKELQKSLSLHEDEITAMKAQIGDLHSTIDTISSNRSDVDAKVSL